VKPPGYKYVGTDILITVDQLDFMPSKRLCHKAPGSDVFIWRNIQTTTAFKTKIEMDEKIEYSRGQIFIQTGFRKLEMFRVGIKILV
jgi:hypothetical protein